MTKHQYHVITPFSRFSNIVEFTRMLRSFNVVWHPIFDDALPFGIHSISWIDAWYCPKAPAGWSAPHFAINYFLNHGLIEDQARYSILADDDFYEPGFFEKIDQHNGEVIICSMMRGHHVPPPPGGTPYTTSTLVAAPENLRVTCVAAEQLIISGRLLRPLRFRPEPFADGLLIEEIAKANPVDFAPEANVWFNYLEPGRWDR